MTPHENVYSPKPLTLRRMVPILSMLLVGTVSALWLHAFHLGERVEADLDNCRWGKILVRCDATWVDKDGHSRAGSVSYVGEPSVKSEVPLRVGPLAAADANRGGAAVLSHLSLVVVVGYFSFPLLRARSMRHTYQAASHRLHHASAEAPLVLVEGRFQTADGTLRAIPHFSHPGPDFRPSACEVEIRTPDGDLLYRVEHAMTTHHPGESRVIDAEGRPLARIRRPDEESRHLVVYDAENRRIGGFAPMDRHYPPVEHALLVAKNQPVARVVGHRVSKHPTHLQIAGHPADATHVTTDVWHGTALTFALFKRHYFGWKTLRRADQTWAKGRVPFATED